MQFVYMKISCFGFVVLIFSVTGIPIFEFFEQTVSLLASSFVPKECLQHVTHLCVRYFGKQRGKKSFGLRSIAISPVER